MITTLSLLILLKYGLSCIILTFCPNVEQQITKGKVRLVKSNIYISIFT